MRMQLGNLESRSRKSNNHSRRKEWTEWLKIEEHVSSREYRWCNSSIVYKWPWILLEVPWTNCPLLLLWGVLLHAWLSSPGGLQNLMVPRSPGTKQLVSQTTLLNSYPASRNICHSSPPTPAPPRPRPPHTPWNLLSCFQHNKADTEGKWPLTIAQTHTGGQKYPGLRSFLRGLWGNGKPGPLLLLQLILHLWVDLSSIGHGWITVESQLVLNLMEFQICFQQ